MVEADKPRGVIWDVDGTLVDTAELHFRAWQELAQRIGGTFTREQFRTTFGRRNPEIIRQVFGDRLSDGEVTRLADQKEELYRSAARKGVNLLPGVRKLLQELRDRGFRQAIGSSAPKRNLDLILEQTRTGEFFDAIVSMEDTDRGKPDPQVFQVAADRLGLLAGRCLVIEDAAAGVEAARRAGMKCIAVRSVGHHDESALRQAGADLIVPSLEAVSASRIGEILG